MWKTLTYFNFIGISGQTEIIFWASSDLAKQVKHWSADVCVILA